MRLVDGTPKRRISHGVTEISIAISIALVAVGLNLLWLTASTVRIENQSSEIFARVAFSACGRDHEIGRLAPGESVFRLLPACGDDTLEILRDEARHCRIYVEGELYHVDAAIRSREHVDCAYDHLFASLLVGKLL